MKGDLRDHRDDGYRGLVSGAISVNQQVFGSQIPVSNTCSILDHEADNHKGFDPTSWLEIDRPSTGVRPRPTSGLGVEGD